MIGMATGKVSPFEANTPVAAWNIDTLEPLRRVSTLTPALVPLLVLSPTTMYEPLALSPAIAAVAVPADN